MRCTPDEAILSKNEIPSTRQSEQNTIISVHLRAKRTTETRHAPDHYKRVGQVMWYNNFVIKAALLYPLMNDSITFPLVHARFFPRRDSII